MQPLMSACAWKNVDAISTSKSAKINSNNFFFHSDKKFSQFTWVIRERPRWSITIKISFTVERFRFEKSQIKEHQSENPACFTTAGLYLNSTRLLLPWQSTFNDQRQKHVRIYYMHSCRCASYSVCFNRNVSSLQLSASAISLSTHFRLLMRP